MTGYIHDHHGHNHCPKGGDHCSHYCKQCGVSYCCKCGKEDGLTNINFRLNGLQLCGSNHGIHP